LPGLEEVAAEVDKFQEQMVSPELAGVCLELVLQEEQVLLRVSLEDFLAGHLTFSIGQAVPEHREKRIPSAAHQSGVVPAAVESQLVPPEERIPVAILVMAEAEVDADSESWPIIAFRLAAVEEGYPGLFRIALSSRVEYRVSRLNCIRPEPVDHLAEMVRMAQVISSLAGVVAVAEEAAPEPQLEVVEAMAVMVASEVEVEAVEAVVRRSPGLRITLYTINVEVMVVAAETASFRSLHIDKSHA